MMLKCWMIIRAYDTADYCDENCWDASMKCESGLYTVSRNSGKENRSDFVQDFYQRAAMEVSKVILVALIWLVTTEGAPPDYVTLTRKMESRILRVMGLSERPRPPPNATAPQYMWDLYKQMSAKEDTGGRSEDQTANARDEMGEDETSEGRRCADTKNQGNIIRSVPNTGG